MVKGRLKTLKREQEQEGHHKTEQSHSLGQSEPENGIGEELLLERRVPRVADDERAEHRPDTGSRTGHTDGGSSGTDEFRSRVDITRHDGGVQRPDRCQRSEHRGHGSDRGLLALWDRRALRRRQNLDGGPHRAGGHAPGQDGGDELGSVHGDC